MFMGRWIRHGGHYPSYHLRLFRTGRGRCEARRYDQHFVVDGTVERLRHDYLDVVASSLLTWTVRHARWAAHGSERAASARTSSGTAGDAGRDGQSDPAAPVVAEPVRARAAVCRGRSPTGSIATSSGSGFLDGKEGLIFHFLQGFWFRFLVDAHDLRARSAGVKILGLNAFHGDASAALLDDGQLVAALEEERLNRIKHWAGFPALAARACLERAGSEPLGARRDLARSARALLDEGRGASSRARATGGARLRASRTRSMSPGSARGWARRASPAPTASACTSSSTTAPTWPARSSRRRSTKRRSCRSTASATSAASCGASAAATASTCAGACASRTRSACSTPRSRSCSVFRSTATNTR